jgi:protein-L-isoaspartate(D-aspartate) O-methyltransferase
MSAANEQMVSQQVRTCEVLDPATLATLRAVPRERFVPAAWSAYAFAEFAVPLAHGKRMLTPVMVGRILQAVAPRPGNLALEIGTGSGYLAACMANMGAMVRSLELHADIAAQAQANLAAAQARGVTVEVADGTLLDESARYDCIVLTGSLPLLDERYQRALKDGGRLFLVHGTGPIMQALLIVREGSVFRSQELLQTRLDALEYAPASPTFRF